MFNSFYRKFPTALTIISFTVPFFSLMGLDMYLSTYLFFFYEVAVGVPVISVVITLGLTRLIIPFMHPILGLISDRNFPFSRTLGRRFFWIILSGILVSIFFVLLFWLPTTDVLIFTILFTTTYLLYNIFWSIHSSSYLALLLNKFRNPKERVLVTAIKELIGTIGLLIIMMFAPIFITWYNLTSYRLISIAIAIVFLVTLSLGVFGLLEEKDLIGTYFSENLASRDWFIKDFFKRFAIFKRKNFLVFVLRWITIPLFSSLFISGLVYFFEYVLNVPIYSVTLAILGYYIWMLIAIPLSFVLSWFIGQYITSIISGFALGGTLIAFFFVNNILMTVILTSLIGFTLGLGMASTIPLMGDVFDEFAKVHRKRSEGIGYGFLSMFSGLTIFLGTFIISIVKGLTGFMEGGGPQPPTAIMGVRMYTSMIPGVIIIAIMILFTTLFDLKRNKTEAIRTELKELEI